MSTEHEPKICANQPCDEYVSIEQWNDRYPEDTRCKAVMKYIEEHGEIPGCPVETAPRNVWSPRGEVPPPSECGPPFTLSEIDAKIASMEEHYASWNRVDTTYDAGHHPECRLSMDATKALRGMLTEAQATIDRQNRYIERLLQMPAEFAEMCERERERDGYSGND